MSDQTPHGGGQPYDPEGQFGLNPHGGRGGGQPGAGPYGAPHGGYSGPPGPAHQQPGPHPGVGPQGPPTGYGQPYAMQSPQTQVGWQPTAPPPPPKKKSSTGLVLGIVGGVLGLVLIAGVAIVAVVVLAKGPDDTIKKYFAALQAGNATEALSYAAIPPADTTLLTDEVLAKANELGGVSDVEVASSSNSTVRVQYRVNGEQVFKTYRMSKGDDGWKINQVAFSLGLRPTVKNAALVVNGVTVPNVDQAEAFPGTYEVATGSKWYSWSESTVVVEGGDLTVGTVGSVEITDEGTEASRAAIKKWLDGCLAKKEFQPKGCPFELKNLNGTADKKTIKWSIEGDHPATMWRPSMLTDVSKVRGSVVYRIRLQFTYTQSGNTYDYDRVAVFGQAMIVDLTKDPIAVTWSS